MTLKSLDTRGPSSDVAHHTIHETLHVPEAEWLSASKMLEKLLGRKTIIKHNTAGMHRGRKIEGTPLHVAKPDKLLSLGKTQNFTPPTKRARGALGRTTSKTKMTAANSLTQCITGEARVAVSAYLSVNMTEACRLLRLTVKRIRPPSGRLSWERKLDEVL